MFEGSELQKFNQKFDAFFSIYGGQSHRPKLSTILRALAAAIVAHSDSTHSLIKKNEISHVEEILKRIYLDSSRQSRRVMKNAVLSAREDGRIIVERVVENLSRALTPGERLNILTTVYELVDADGVRTPSEKLFVETLHKSV
jgi:uncharacterized tellurite resistance protein B-like protein